MKIPGRSDEQIKRVRALCRSLYLKFKNFSWIIDDESYFTLTHSTINGNNIFYSGNPSVTPARVKYYSKVKFEKKLLVWICISVRGVSSVFFVPSGMAINQEVYLKSCIQRRLIPFINAHHSDGNYVFWPDLASAHYAKTVVDYLNEKKVKFVQKSENPPNVPEARPIEDFWGLIKGEVYKNNWQAENIDQLKNRINLCLKKIGQNRVYDLMSTVANRLNNIRMHGVIGAKKT